MIALLANICMGYAQDALLALREDHALAKGLQMTLQQQDFGELEVIHRLLQAGCRVDDTSQLAFSLDLFVAGAEARLADPRATPDRDPKAVA